MAEADGDRLPAAGVNHRPGRPILHPGHDGTLLDPAEGRPHRSVVRLDDSGGGERRFYRALIARFPDRPPVEFSGIAGHETGD